MSIEWLFNRQQKGLSKGRPFCYHSNESKNVQKSLLTHYAAFLCGKLISPLGWGYCVPFLMASYCSFAKRCAFSLNGDTVETSILLIVMGFFMRGIWYNNITEGTKGDAFL